MMVSKRIECIKLYQVKEFSFLHVKYEKENVEESYRAFYFVELAFKEYQLFGDDYKLLKAVEFGVKELLFENYREDFLDYITRKEAKGQVGKSKESDANILFSRDFIWRKVHYYLGQGIKLHATNGALVLAGEDYGSIGRTTAKTRYKEAAELLERAANDKSSPNVLRLIKDVYFRRGRIDKVKEIINAAIVNKKGKEYGITLACQELKIKRSECLKFYEANGQ
ncbi:hypothetical protein I6F53_03745 [Pseudoalteromonas sp. SWN29]|uniref:hypothetical protein n=1 Tax=Pseudoalteromonas sp. SWN29 TaxID=2792064 RepID=UPI0018CCCAEB|nr:hypothetical protein [Pseudoalteromonas sp. SWN29]MBH0026090.1 hypothetical protein [Pseudoalteromonas sp. SWN29]